MVKEKHKINYDVVIIGGGLSAMGAAIYTGRFKMKTLLLAQEIGGTILKTDEVANYPGFNSISGLELATNLENHMKDYNIEIQETKVENIDKHCDACFKIELLSGNPIHAKSIIIATGSDWKKLDVPGENDYISKGVHYCAICDGAFYKDKTVAVIGGADSAAKEALMLTRYAEKVYMIIRGDKLKSEPINKERILADKKIEIIFNTSVNEIIGEKFVTGIKIDNPYKDNDILPVNGVFVSIGNVAKSEIIGGFKVILNDKKEIKIGHESETNIPGIFAAGDVTDHRFKQGITGVSQGVTAAYSAYHHVNKKEAICFCNDKERKPGENISEMMTQNHS